MITLQDHIDELRAELRGCLDRRERTKIAAEIEAAIAAPRRRTVPPRRRSLPVDGIDSAPPCTGREVSPP
jgi:hypothetical protein